MKNCADAPPVSQTTSKSSDKPIKSLIDCVASSTTAPISLLRWLISKTDMPVPFIFNTPFAASLITDAGKIAGPALKL